MLTNIIVTAYCACTICCGPNASNITASGKKPTEGVTVACNFLPFGSVVHIDTVGERVVQDRLAKRYSDRIDVYFKSHKQAKKFGKKKLKVRIKQ